MVAYCKRETGTLSVTFQRDGEPPKRVEVTDGRMAVKAAVMLILEHQKLRGGDCLTVEISN